MAFKMKYSPNKKSGEGFPYKGEASPNKFLGKALRGAAKGIGGLARGIFGGRRSGGGSPVGAGGVMGGIYGGMSGMGQFLAKRRAGMSSGAAGNVDESIFQKNGKIRKAKKLVRKNVGKTTVDSPETPGTTRQFKRSDKKINKAVNILRKQGYSEEDIEQFTGAGGFGAAMDWAMEPGVRKRDKKLKRKNK
jgi:hypothetical protein